MSFECTNSIDKGSREQNLEKGKSGIGLINAKKRLDLLYPNKHQLNVMKDEKKYSVKLIIDL